MENSVPWEGQTHLESEELEGLIPSVVATYGDIFSLEQANILEATRWVLRTRHKNLLTDIFVRQLHERMFCHVWKWAGQYRTTLKNIGVAPEQIAVQVRDLCADAHLWVEKKTFPWDELAARFHHRLVSIHSFPNGNGRHARLMADVLLHQQGQPFGTWGAVQAEKKKEDTQTLRKRYLDALRAADRGEVAPLILFIRS
jgi:Fic-DOC domain mobile mystery protein B